MDTETLSTNEKPVQRRVEKMVAPHLGPAENIKIAGRRRAGASNKLGRNSMNKKVVVYNQPG